MEQEHLPAMVRDADALTGQDLSKLSDAELKDWVGKIRGLAAEAKKTYVFFNNCHAGQAATNARLMQQMLKG